MTQRILEIVCEEADLSPAEIGPDTDFMRKFNVDSLDLLEIILAVEEAFGVEIPEEAYDEIRTVNDIAAYVRRG